MVFKAVTVLFLLTCGIFGIFVRNRIRKYAARKEFERQLLLDKWKFARQERQSWYEDHKMFFDFYNPEYQRLWDIEIGAEALYIIHEQGPIGKFITHFHISWSDYKAEKHCFDTQST